MSDSGLIGIIMKGIRYRKFRKATASEGQTGLRIRDSTAKSCPINPSSYKVSAVHHMVVNVHKKLQAMARHGPEYHGQGHRAGRDERGDPECPPDEELLHVRLANAQRAERRGLGLAQEDKDGVQLVLVRNKEENGDGVWEEELLACQRQARRHRKDTYEETLRLGLYVQEDERKADGKADPEDDEPDDEPHKRRHGREVAEGLRA